MGTGDTPAETPAVDDSGLRRPDFEPLPNPDLPFAGQYPPAPPSGPPAPPVPRGAGGISGVGRAAASSQQALKNLGRRARSASRAAAGQARHKGPSDGRVVKERLRHVSPTSVLKISLIFYSCVALVFLISSLIIWQFARGSGAVDDVESFVTDLFAYGNCEQEEDVPLGEDVREDDECSEGQVLVGSFEIDDTALLQSLLLGGAVFVVAATGGTVFLVLLFNVLSDVTGGVRYSVVREALSSGTKSTGGRGQR